MTNMDQAAIAAFAEAVAAAHDPVERLRRAVVAAVWDSPVAARAGGGNAGRMHAGRRPGSPGEIRMHAERHPGGTLLRMTEAAGGRTVEVVLDGDEARSLAGYLGTTPRR